MKNDYLMDKSDISGFIVKSDLDKKIETLAIKAGLKAEQGKIEKLQTYVSTLFIGHTYFINEVSQIF